MIINNTKKILNLLCKGKPGKFIHNNKPYSYMNHVWPHQIVLFDQDYWIPRHASLDNWLKGFMTGPYLLTHNMLFIDKQNDLQLFVDFWK